MMGSIIVVLLCIIAIMILLAKEEYEQALEDQKMRDSFRELQKTSELTFPNGVTIPVTEERLKDIWEGMKQPKGNLIDKFIIL
jgi:hypothetical protein